VVGHRYLGTVPKVMADATTTPIGCQMESKDKRNRRFCGKNSRASGQDESCQQIPDLNGRTRSKLTDGSVNGNLSS